VSAEATTKDWRAPEECQSRRRRAMGDSDSHRPQRAHPDRQPADGNHARAHPSQRCQPQRHAADPDQADGYSADRDDPDRDVTERDDATRHPGPVPVPSPSTDTDVNPGNPPGPERERYSHGRPGRVADGAGEREDVFMGHFLDSGTQLPAATGVLGGSRS
jgi:hypothetical protein